MNKNILNYEDLKFLDEEEHIEDEENTEDYMIYDKNEINDNLKEFDLNGLIDSSLNKKNNLEESVKLEENNLNIINSYNDDINKGEEYNLHNDILEKVEEDKKKQNIQKKCRTEKYKK